MSVCSVFSARKIGFELFGFQAWSSKAAAVSCEELAAALALLYLFVRLYDTSMRLYIIQHVGQVPPDGGTVYESVAVAHKFDPALLPSLFLLHTLLA